MTQEIEKLSFYPNYDVYAVDVWLLEGRKPKPISVINPVDLEKVLPQSAMWSRVSVGQENTGKAITWHWDNIILWLHKHWCFGRKYCFFRPRHVGLILFTALNFGDLSPPLHCPLCGDCTSLRWGPPLYCPADRDSSPTALPTGDCYLNCTARQQTLPLRLWCLLWVGGGGRGLRCIPRAQKKTTLAFTPRKFIFLLPS